MQDRIVRSAATALISLVTLALWSTRATAADNQSLYDQQKAKVEGLEKGHQDLKESKNVLDDLQKKIQNNEVVLIRDTDGSLVPVDHSAFLEAKRIKILLDNDTQEDRIRAQRKLDDELIAAKAASLKALRQLDYELRVEALDNYAALGHARDDLKATAKKEPWVELPPDRSSAISDEERAESPPAPDAATRTLSVDSKTPPPPDDTPIVDASAAPPTPPRDQYEGGEDDDAIGDVQTFVGISGPLTRQNRPRGRGHHNGHDQHQQSGHRKGC
jgi:hypothetical protein